MSVANLHFTVEDTEKHRIYVAGPRAPSWICTQACETVGNTMAVLGDTMLSGQLRLRYVDKNRNQHSLNWQMQQGWRLQLKGQQAPQGQGALLKWPYVPAPRRAGPVNVLSEISGSETGEGRMALEGGLGPERGDLSSVP